MGKIVMRSITVNVDVQSELENFDWGVNVKWQHDKLIAASPFRYDNSPSFFVFFEDSGKYDAGMWGDSGAFDDDWSSGDFVKLLSFLRNETREECEDYLLESYAPRSGGSIKLVSRTLHINTPPRALASDTVTTATSAYLLSRGIPADIQKSAGVGYGKHHGFCALPWHSADGRLLNVKYRATRGKAFFYEKDATPIGKIVYGANTVKDSSITTVLCEAEIDALSYRTVGVQAIAVGGVAFSRDQVDVIQRLPIGKLVIAGDNDRAGKQFNRRAYQMLRHSVNNLELLSYNCSEYKDSNDILKKTQSVKALRQMLEGALKLPNFSQL